mmetsp:Transcript_48403/g.115088  ORF Transcript_48403/g.115088 Transcript_48403/m.115088 type:complete len:230 (+) Transcript_48403:101-790(+)
MVQRVWLSLAAALAMAHVVASEVGGNCTLSDNSTSVSHGWSGKDVARNWCHDCSCSNGALACGREEHCPPPPPLMGCALADGSRVPNGWAGKDRGSNFCNSCRCQKEMLACTRMMCHAPPPPAGESSCKLSDGTAVPEGWSGKDVGGNWCNKCRCSGGMLACTAMACAQEESRSQEAESGCKLSDGSEVPSGWAGKDVGDNYCNKCMCSNGSLACTLMLCEKREVTLLL